MPTECPFCTRYVDTDCPNRYTFSTPWLDFDIHEDCFETLGLHESSGDVVTAAIAYAEAMNAESFFEAMDVFLTRRKAADDSWAMELAAMRLVVDYGRGSE